MKIKYGFATLCLLASLSSSIQLRADIDWEKVFTGLIGYFDNPIDYNLIENIVNYEIDRALETHSRTAQTQEQINAKKFEIARNIINQIKSDPSITDQKLAERKAQELAKSALIQNTFDEAQRYAEKRVREIKNSPRPPVNPNYLNDHFTKFIVNSTANDMRKAAQTHLYQDDSIKRFSGDLLEQQVNRRVNTNLGLNDYTQSTPYQNQPYREEIDYSEVRMAIKSYVEQIGYKYDWSAEKIERAKNNISNSVINTLQHQVKPLTNVHARSQAIQLTHPEVIKLINNNRPSAPVQPPQQQYRSTPSKQLVSTTQSTYQGVDYGIVRKAVNDHIDKLLGFKDESLRYAISNAIIQKLQHSIQPTDTKTAELKGIALVQSYIIDTLANRSEVLARDTMRAIKDKPPINAFQLNSVTVDAAAQDIRNKMKHKIQMSILQQESLAPYSNGTIVNAMVYEKYNIPADIQLIAKKECPSCWDTYEASAEAPVILPCGHHVCPSCLVDIMYGHGDQTCPGENDIPCNAHIPTTLFPESSLRAVANEEKLKEKGLAKDTIVEIGPEFNNQYRKETFEKSKKYTHDICSSCQNDFSEIGKRVTLYCGHSICPTCLYNWMYKYNKTTCPDCRAEILKNEFSAAYLAQYID